jgi:hypothetical protein
VFPEIKFWWIEQQRIATTLTRNSFYLQAIKKEHKYKPGYTTIIHPVKDIAKAKILYNDLLGVKPIMDEAYYVGYRIGNQDIGLDPDGSNQGMTGPVGYYQVSDIKSSLQTLLDDGAQ